MARKQPKAPEKPKPEIPPHRHELKAHEHPLFEHDHAHEHPQRSPLPHDHPLLGHEHAQMPHEHAAVVQAMSEYHRVMQGHLRGTTRALLAVIELGSVNTEQRAALHNVRVTLGDAHGSGCAHESQAYEAGDVLVCQDCRESLPSPDAAG